jgi:hypothetical protein
MLKLVLGALAGCAAMVAVAQPASAKTCAELRQLCHTMRSDKSDCTRPYQRCLSTGTFITPLGRVFKATPK